MEEDERSVSGGEEQESPRIENVAVDGDVILVVGPDRRKICVNSVVLRHASRYFRNMFSGN